MAFIDSAEHAAPPAGELTPNYIFDTLFGHLTPHTLKSFKFFGTTWNVTNNLLIMLLAGVLVFVLFRFGHAGRRTIREQGIPRGRLPNVLEALVQFVRDEMIYPTMGPANGRKFAPLFLTQFFFIWMMNLLSNLPLGKFGAAPTANLATTAALASTTLVVMLAGGIKASGPIGMWKDLVPHGLPPVIREILFVVEVAGFFIKPVALTIRLFANMFGGHLVVLSLFGLVYVFKSYMVYGLVLPMSLFVGALELLVAFLQAFIFTFLSILFVQASIHPEH